ncbi:MAG: hypothetical protein WHV67_08720 [Thermoanaerobaculia bacterium]
MKNFLFLCFLALVSVSLFPQAPPPERINYQGVLRDASGNPLQGNFSMVFRFYNSQTGGTLLWEETYDLSHLPQINVSNGLFSVQLGDISHKTAGSEINFSNVFSKYSDVYLGVQVGTDAEMTPRIKVISSAFSQNANTFDGRESDYFLNTSSTTQTKTGKVIFNATGSNYGVEAYGMTSGGYFKDNDGSGYASIGISDSGIRAYGNTEGGYFQDLDNLSTARVAYGNYGVYAQGNTSGGYFQNTTAGGTAYAYLGYLNGTLYQGIYAQGSSTGGYFKDADNTGYAYVGYGDRGIEAQGNEVGGYFRDSNGTGLAFIAFGNIGVQGEGSFAGGYFHDYDGTGYTYAGYGDTGIEAAGNYQGAYFYDFNSSAYSRVAYGDRGIEALGNETGGYFKDADHTGQAFIGYGDLGISSSGNSAGGYFKDLDSSGYAFVGYGDYGIDARGNTAGGYFYDIDAFSYAKVASSGFGIEAYGNDAGAYFKDLYKTGFAYIGKEDTGVEGYGNTAGGYFVDSNNSGYGQVGYSTYKIQGNGTVSFVQNHPYEKDKVIVYAAPEGDEVATYTRGTGRLINGEARIKLGETFKWVTNPDIGLTVYLTPVGQWAELYVEKKSTDEIIVKSKDTNSNSVFDYIVYGLRIGFEESSIVQEKQIESYIPSFKDHRERYKKYPDFIKYNALERFKNMEAEVKGISKDQIDLSKAIALKEAIHEYDPEKDPPVEKLFGHNLPEEPSNEITEEGIKEEGIQNAPIVVEKEIKEENKKEIIREEKLLKEEEDLSCFVVYGQTEEGDVVVMNIQNGSSLVLSNKEYDKMVVGVVSDEKKCTNGKVYVKTSGVAYVKVDANIKEIKRGDLIVTSQSLGYGMKGENAPQGTVIGKALENLEGGTGKIKVLLMAR